MDFRGTAGTEIAALQSRQQYPATLGAKILARYGDVLNDLGPLIESF